jgi:hypothetical protein
MSANYLTKRQLEILHYLRESADKDDKYILDKSINGSLKNIEIETVCRVINDEYLMRGVEKDYRPNGYGRELEELLDVINRPRLTSRD